MKILTILIFAILVGVGIYLSLSENGRETEAIETIEERSGESLEEEKDLKQNSSPQATNGGEFNDQPPRIFIENEGSDQLFADMPDDRLSLPDVEAYLAKRHIFAYRIVSVDSDQLRKYIRDFPAIKSFDIRLLDSELVTLVTSAAAEHTDGWQSGYASWVGGVDGDETSSATLFVAPDGSVNGQVRTTDEGRIKIENISGTAAHLIWQRTSGFAKKPD